MTSLSILKRPILSTKSITPTQRSLTMASAASLTSRTSSISNTITQDHVQLRNAYNKILGTSDLDEKVRWQNQFTWDLARHAVGEELVVYPALEKVLADGKRVADKDREEHQTVKEYLYKFQALKPTDTEFEPTLRNLWGDLSAHIRKEEEEDLVRLEHGLSEQESLKLAASFARTKLFVPTRSHPGAPDKPPFETIAGLLTAPVDKLVSVFRRFPE